MKSWLVEKVFGPGEDLDEEVWGEDGATPYLEESVAYSSFLASEVAEIEEVSFEEFLRLLRAGQSTPHMLEQE